jgi:hypothetical protein
MFDMMDADAPEVRIDVDAPEVRIDDIGYFNFY